MNRTEQVMKDTKKQKHRCRNCEYANSHLVGWPFIFCYIKGRNRLRCSRCKLHTFKHPNNFTNTL